MEGGGGAVVGEPVVPINNTEVEDVAILVKDNGAVGGQRWQPVTAPPMLVLFIRWMRREDLDGFGGILLTLII